MRFALNLHKSAEVGIVEGVVERLMHGNELVCTKCDTDDHIQMSDLQTEMSDRSLGVKQALTLLDDASRKRVSPVFIKVLAFRLLYPVFLFSLYVYMFIPTKNCNHHRSHMLCKNLRLVKCI